MTSAPKKVKPEKAAKSEYLKVLTVLAGGIRSDLEIRREKISPKSQGTIHLNEVNVTIINVPQRGYASNAVLSNFF